MQSVTDADGNVTYYVYDLSRRVISETDGYGTAAAVTTTMADDPAGDLSSETTGQSPNNAYGRIRRRRRTPTTACAGC